MNFTFPDIGNVIIPTDELIFFRGVGIPPTRIIQHLETLSCDSCGFARLTLGQVFGQSIHQSVCMVPRQHALRLSDSGAHVRDFGVMVHG